MTDSDEALSMAREYVAAQRAARSVAVDAAETVMLIHTISDLHGMDADDRLTYLRLKNDSANHTIAAHRQDAARIAALAKVLEISEGFDGHIETLIEGDLEGTYSLKAAL